MELLEAFKQLDAKQKMTAMITVVLLVFLIYFAYDTFAGNGDTDIAPPPAKQSASTGTQPAPENTAMVQEHPLPQQASMASLDPVAQHHGSLENADPNDVLKQPMKQPDFEQLAFLQQTKEMQKEYLRLVNEYQLAQLQQKLEEARAQISDARLKYTVSSAKQQQLQTELEGKGQLLASPTEGGTTRAEAATGVQVVYVGQRRGQWTALLSEGGAYFEVREGTRLADDWRVVTIARQGVILQRKDQRKVLRMPKNIG